MRSFDLAGAVPWAPHPALAPQTERMADGRFRIRAGACRSCCGGWQFPLTDLTAGSTVDVEVSAQTANVPVPRDRVLGTVYWGSIAANEARVPYERLRDFLVPVCGEDGGVRFARTLTVPPGVTEAVLRVTLRWTPGGEVCLSPPRLVPASAAVPARRVRAAAVTGVHGARPRVRSVHDNIGYYASLCSTACRQADPELIVLPEIALHWGLGTHPWDHAVCCPGPETDPFAEIAAAHGCHIALGLHEREGDAVHNTLALLAPDGTVPARYRKVHLATGGENECGVVPGDAFPTAATPFGRVGFNICMDSSALESARMPALAGAEILALAIMGDHRAGRWTPGLPIFHEDRWRAIMRTRAMDNQMALVVARNQTIGSCVVSPKGDVLAWNEGDEPFVCAEVTLRPEPRCWNGNTFRAVNWMLRRPHLYGPFTDQTEFGSVSHLHPIQMSH